MKKAAFGALSLAIFLVSFLVFPAERDLSTPLSRLKGHWKTQMGFEWYFVLHPEDQTGTFLRVWPDQETLVEYQKKKIMASSKDGTNEAEIQKEIRKAQEYFAPKAGTRELYHFSIFEHDSQGTRILMRIFLPGQKPEEGEPTVFYIEKNGLEMKKYVLPLAGRAKMELPSVDENPIIFIDSASGQGQQGQQGQNQGKGGPPTGKPLVVAKLETTETAEPGKRMTGELQFNLQGGAVEGWVEINLVASGATFPLRQSGQPAAGRFTVRATLRGTYDGGLYGLIKGDVSLAGTFVDDQKCEVRIDGKGTFSGSVNAPFGRAEVALQLAPLDLKGCDLKTPQPAPIFDLPAFVFKETDSIRDDAFLSVAFGHKRRGS